MRDKISNTIRMAQSYFPEDDIQTFLKEIPNILNGRVSMGNWVRKFEKAAAYAQCTNYAIATNSCTSALEVSMLASGIKPGDKVLVPVQTFIATGMAVYNIGAEPVFCDVRKETLCLDPEEINNKEQDGVKGVILVHFGGLISPDTLNIREICLEKGYSLIEDAAHAHGANLNGKSAGLFGDIACFSYYPTKLLTTGEGGMIVTNRKDLENICRSYQYRGQDLNLPGEQFALPYGRNIRLSELNALLGVLQYKRLDEFIYKRRAVADIYNNVLENEKTIFIPPVPDECFHSYWLYTIILPEGANRDIIKKKCLDVWNINIDWSYYPPLHLMPVFKTLYGYKKGTLPVAENILSRTVCLPIHPLISKEEAQYVGECFLDVYHQMI